MKAVILAGGYGTRISEESHLKPKPMIEIGEKPILWHIMKLYSYYNINDFIICCGYKQHIIKEYFANYYLRNSNITFDFSNSGKMIVHNDISEPWRVTLIDTGQNTMTGGRIKRIQPYIDDEEFMVTYGDGVSNVNLDNLFKFHKNHNKIATLTTVNVDQRFGVIESDINGQVCAFREKNVKDNSAINGGFMVFKRQIFKYIQSDDVVLEKEVFNQLVENGELMCYKHNGFWKCMDTQRDKQYLETVWQQGHAPWKVWE